MFCSFDDNLIALTRFFSTRHNGCLRFSNVSNILDKHFNNNSYFNDFLVHRYP